MTTSIIGDNFPVALLQQISSFSPSFASPVAVLSSRVASFVAVEVEDGDSVEEEAYMDILKGKDVESSKGNDSVEKKWRIKVGVEG